MAPSGTQKNHKSKRSDLSSEHSQPPVNVAGPVPGGLYILATPIGNARDITLRALDTLRAADVIVCEDTRVTSKLLAIHGISRPLTAYHEHNADKAGPAIIERLKKGQTVALVSDAGTPLISDPGYRLVRACAAEGLFVTHLPGPSSVLTALVLAGLPTDRFLFSGFLTNKSGKRQTELMELKAVTATLVFLESPKRLAKSLADMAVVLGPREAAIGRELTKKFEEVRRGTLEELAEHYAEAGAPKGEVTIVVAPPLALEGKATVEDIDRLLGDALDSLSLKDAVAAVSAATGAPRRNVYSRALALSSMHK
ncbi:MAG: 16S rRNA (cytidine(1402)-2'-O)-methyltransferase [Rhodospirillales bacterium]|nr:16S rRNA (cytidine(1402)-2'-O)-methyltransferase [Rhodospirillales bacterium]